jgi:hypothetical protein
MDKATCAAMSAEYQGLIAAGLKADLEKGPEWGKANLNEERLKLIARLIEVEETLAFRCRTLAIPVKRREAVPGLDPAATGEIDTATPAGASAAKAKQKKRRSRLPRRRLLRARRIRSRGVPPKPATPPQNPM